MSATIPNATYRLQFNKDFTFNQGRDLVPYLHRLGISHIYASPVFRAVPGSVHGYDICSHNELNPEIGSEADFAALASELERHGMGMILDFVPNHMGIAEATNTWWMDVLENGPSSLFAKFFDIDWRPTKRELENKVLLPILGDQYGRVLENRELKLCFHEGAFSIHYFDRKLPVGPKTTLPLLASAREFLGGAEGPVLDEFDSILRALDHLPPPTERDVEMMQARAKEKEVIKARLARLCKEDPAVEAAVAQAVGRLQEDTPDGLDALDRFISAQPYRLASWRVAGEEINYRRFFDVNSLAALRMELPEVYEATHRYLFELLSYPAVQGLRIDHIDGLYDPGAYLTKLQQGRAAKADADAAPGDKPLYLLVEKILGPGEHLRADWPVHGTTGYEAGNQLTALLVDRSAERALSELYEKFTGSDSSYSDIVYESKLLVMKVLMPSEVNALGFMLNRISETSRCYRDFTLNSLTAAIREVIACFPVYRTYLTPDRPASEVDVKVLNRAIAAARRRNPSWERSVFDFLRSTLVPDPGHGRSVDEEARRKFVMKFQQCTGPITAKGVEDTAFYRYNRLVALNEVGGEPDIFGEPLETFHEKNSKRLEGFPHSMLATSTHDTKRSEDVRARIAALSELPQDWSRAVRRWHTVNRKHRHEIGGLPAPSPNEEYLLYQTLLGSWPLHPMSATERQDYIRRIQDYMLKAVHEAKENSGWLDPNKPWEDALTHFVQKILTPARHNRFLANFEPLALRVAELGMVNSLAQTVLKLTMPGVPDIYQGQETWDFSLVDPDNRRPVDYSRRMELLEPFADEAGPSCQEMLTEWRDGRIKLFVTQRILRFRRDHPALFQAGSYAPVQAAGELAECCVANRREHEGGGILVIVPRFSSRVGSPPIGGQWKDTKLVNLPPGKKLTDLFCGKELPPVTDLPLSEALADFPVAVYAWS